MRRERRGVRLPEDEQTRGDVVYQLLFMRTRRATSEGGFFSTIQSMTDVATDKLYLHQSQDEERRTSRTQRGSREEAERRHSDPV